MPRTKSEFVVLKKATQDTYHVVAGGMGSTKEAQRYLKEHGKTGEEYRIAALGRLVAVTVMSITRRKLVDAAQAGNALQPDLDD